MQVKTISEIEIEPITVDQVKNYLKIDESIEVEDALISSMIKAARQLCEKKTNLSFIDKQLEAVFEYDELIEVSFRLPYSPHYEIVSIHLMDEYGDETELENTLYWSSKGNIWEVTINPSVNIFKQARINYKAGFGVDGKTEALPEQAVIAILKQVGSWYDNRGDYIPTLSSDVRRILESISLTPWF